MTKALILTDIQNDFLPGGALGVDDGDRILPIINELISNHPFDMIVASKDWHSAKHCSFASTHHKKPGDKVTLGNREQVLWADHCVAESSGAAFSDQLNTKKIKKVFHKGTDENIDSYSAFYDNGHLKSTGLREFLEAKKIKEIYLVGLTTEYCIKWSALDAIFLGFDTYVIIDACKPINLKASDERDAIKEMQEAGVHVIKSADLLKA